jgi:RNA polymerase sigma factor FliA
MGLLDAARRFDPARDVRFETFAEHRIRGAMLDELRRMDHLPRRLRAQAEQLERARARLGQELMREPTTEELAAALGVPIEEAEAVAQLGQPLLSLSDEGERHEAPGAEEAVSRAELLRAVSGAVAALPERLALVLSLHYAEGLTYREISKVLEVSEPRVCQLHGEALALVRTALRQGAPR